MYIIWISVSKDYPGGMFIENLFVWQVEHSAGKTVYLDWDRVRMFDKEVAQMFLNIVKGEEDAE